MNVIATTRNPSASQSVQHFDVLIVGAGISGVGSAYHLTTQLPGTSFVVLETQERFGGTWWSHRFPGVRSDSDLHTFGYRHRISSATWSSKTNLWTIEAVKIDSGETLSFTANFLWMCQGYYRHSE